VVNLFSRPIILFDMGYEAANRQLILGTGNDGQLLRLDVEAREAAVLYKAKPARRFLRCWYGRGGLYGDGKSGFGDPDGQGLCGPGGIYFAGNRCGAGQPLG